MKCKEHTTRLTWEYFMPFRLWHLWLKRNNNVHNSKSASLDNAYVYGKVIEFTHVITHSRGETTPAQHLSVKWEPYDKGKYKLNVDGAVAGSLGLGGIGGVLRDHNGKWVLGFT